MCVYIYIYSTGFIVSKKTKLENFQPPSSAKDSRPLPPQWPCRVCPPDPQQEIRLLDDKNPWVSYRCSQSIGKYIHTHSYSGKFWKIISVYLHVYNTHIYIYMRRSFLLLVSLRSYSYSINPIALVLPLRVDRIFSFVEFDDLGRSTRLLCALRRKICCPIAVTL